MVPGRRTGRRTGRRLRVPAVRRNRPDPKNPGHPGLPACRAGRSRTGGQPSLTLRQDRRVMTVTLSREKRAVTNARPVRSERSDVRRQTMPVVAVTGAAGGIGYALTARLAASPKVRRVIAIDGQRGDI